MDSNVSALIEKNLAEINEYLLDVEKATGRHIHLVGATKTRTAEEINFAVDCGLKIVGENRAQEFRDKLPLVSDLAEKHFIGHLQANKIKYAKSYCQNRCIQIIPKRMRYDKNDKHG